MLAQLSVWIGFRWSFSTLFQATVFLLTLSDKVQAEIFTQVLRNQQDKTARTTSWSCWSQNILGQAGAIYKY